MKNFFLFNLKIIEPYNSIRCSLDILIMFSLLFDIFYTPLMTTFLYNINTGFSFFNKAIIILLAIDVFANLHTAYYSKGDFIKMKSKILKNYIKNNILIDFLIFVPFFVHSSPKASWIFFFRILRFRQILKKVNEFLQFTQYTQAIIDLIKLIVLIMYLAHLCGCAFFEIAQFQINLYNSQETWLHAKDLIGKSWYSQYINSIYFAVVTMITVGYGDIYPQNNTERTFTIFIMIISWITFGFSLNSIGQILGELMKEGKILK